MTPWEYGGIHGAAIRPRFKNIEGIYRCLRIKVQCSDSYTPRISPTGAKCPVLGGTQTCMGKPSKKFSSICQKGEEVIYCF